MPGIMADNDVQGQFNVLLQIFQSETWQGIWERLGITEVSFAGLGLAPNASDAQVWHACQDRNVVLFTGNRNKEAADSLEATLRTCNEAHHLPVITLSDAKRFSYDRAYVEKVAVKFLEILMSLDDRRGDGRLYVP